MPVTLKDDVLTTQAEDGKYRISTPTKYRTPASSTTSSLAASPVITAFSFPTLNSDGSTPDLIVTYPRPGEVTPPAALSTAGIKMAERNKKSELEDGQYDMIEDASEFSLDGQETVSIASSDDHSTNDGQATPEDTGSVADAGEILFIQHSEAKNDTEQPLSAAILANYQTQLRLLEQQKEAAAAREKTEAQKTEQELESFLSDDLETPRQSTVYKRYKPETDSTEVRAVDESDKSKTSKVSKSFSQKLKTFLSSPANYGVIFMIISLVITGTSFFLSVNSTTSQAMRKVALDTALENTIGISDIAKTVNSTHLLPMPTHISTNIFGQQTLGVSDVHFQAMAPNNLIVSLPSTDSRIPLAESAQALKGDKPIAFNQTMLIPGVYKFDFDTREAYGIVTVNMQTTKPLLNITVSHNYGRRMFQKQTYETARTDLAKAVNKDVDVARKSAKSLTERLQLELGASVAATRNVTTQLAVHINRDLQLWVSNTASALTKAAVAGNRTYFSIQKDLMRVEKRLDDAGSDAYKRLSIAGAQVAKSVTKPLVLSRERAVALKDRLFGCKQGKHVQVVKREGRILRTAARKLKAGKVPSMAEKRVKGTCGKKGGHMK